ncbi:MAG: hypothetical protein AABY22_02440 [Nanoarchaeota archaeon]
MTNQTEINAAKCRLFGDGMMNRKDRYSEIQINHIPIMITDSGKILCIPQNKETQHIGITGQTGKGKGILNNSLLGMEHYMNKTHCLILNDFQSETHENSLPSMNNIFNENLKVINVKPQGLPIVYVYPSNRSLKINDTELRFPHIKMSLPTESIIRNIEHYYKLDKSAKYVTAYIDKFLECKDLEQIREVLDEILPDKGENKNKVAAEMKFKILASFKNIFDERLCNSVAPEAPAFLNVLNNGIKYSNMTIQALMFCDFIPSIQTSEIRNKRWFSAYMSYIVENIYRDKYEDESFLKNNKISMYVPELDKMWKNDNGELIKTALGLTGTNGRRAGIGLRWDAQDYDSIPDSIRSNTKYLFVLRKANADEVRGIAKDFGVDKNIVEAILHLNTDASKGLFECVALTTDKFILYSENGSTTYTSAPQKGRLITPMAQHCKPGYPLSCLLEDLK